MENSNDQPLKILKDQVTEYVELKSEYARLILIEGFAKIAAYFSTTIIIGTLVILFLTSVLVACSLFLGQYFHNYGMGFLASSGIYLLLLLVFLAAWRKRSERSIINKIVQLTNSDERN
jgi:small-conductance mechanosensitive channel